MRNKIGMAILLGIFALSPGLARAESHEGHSLEQLVVEMAHTPADHAALAAHYRAKAAEARADASEHERMAQTYSMRKEGALGKMGPHCKKIAANSMATAAEYDALAAFHETESKKAK